MLWGYNQVTQFQRLVKGIYANCALGMNEWVHDFEFFFSNIKLNYVIRPDISSQSNIAPEAAAQLWMANIQPLKAQGYTLVAPAIAFSISWLKAFIAACTGCTVRIISYHYVLRHGLNNSFLASSIFWLRTFITLIRPLWLNTLTPSTLRLITRESGWQNGPARSVGTSPSCLAIDRITLRL